MKTKLYNKKDYNKEYQQRPEVKERKKQYDKKRNHNPKVKKQRRDRLLQKKYGITLEKYNQMFDEQQGKCKICRKHRNDLTADLCVDHDHNSGNIRGLLCHDCNLMLGYAKDKIEILLYGIMYLSVTQV